MSDYPTPTPVTQGSQAPAPTPAPQQAMSPYQTPNTHVPATNVSGEISSIAISHLVRTRKWVRLCSVMGFIGSAFMILAGIIMMATGGMLGASSGLRGSAYSTGLGIGMGLFYLVFAVLYIYPSLRLWQYASSITRLEQSRDSYSLETALDRQRSFWKFVGIMILLLIILYAVMFIFLFIGAATSRM